MATLDLLVVTNAGPQSRSAFEVVGIHCCACPPLRTCTRDVGSFEMPLLIPLYPSQTAIDINGRTRTMADIALESEIARLEERNAQRAEAKAKIFEVRATLRARRAEQTGKLCEIPGCIRSTDMLY